MRSITFFTPRPEYESLDDFFARPFDYDWSLVDAAIACGASAPVVDNLDHLRRTHAQGQRELTRPPDLTLDAAAALEDNAAAVVAFIRARLQR